MGADLFESYVASILGAMILGAVASSGNLQLVILPLVIAAVGIVVSVIFTYFVRVKEGGNPQVALDLGSFGAAAVMLLLSIGIINYFVDQAGGSMVVGDKTVGLWDLWIPMAGGLAAGVAIGVITGYYCSKNKPPVDSIVEQSKTGPATNIIAGIGVGFESTAIPIVLIVGAIYVANLYAGIYGVALAALGMLSTTGIQLAVDAYGPISDNAGGIAEMSGLPPQGPRAHRQPRRGGQHHRGHRQGLRHRLGRPRGAVPVRRLPQASRWATAEERDLDRPQGAHRPAGRRHAAVLVLGDGHEGRR